jgi:hypothetical protein
MYLLSRSELFRLIGMDTDKKLLIVGADEDLRRWIDVAIGGNTALSGTVPDEGQYDIVLCCKELSGEEEEALEKAVSPEGTVWTITNDPGGASVWKPFDRTNVIARMR